MIILKKWIREFLSLFVFLRFKDIWSIYDYLIKNNLKSGLVASVFSLYCENKSSFIGIGAQFDNIPYFPHGLHGVFISEGAHIGKNCIIFQQVTIGSNSTEGSKRNGAPVIGDNCYIAAGAKIIGNVKVGNNCRIGANAIVYEDIPDNSVVVSSHTRVIARDELMDNNFYKKDSDGNVLYWDFELRKFVKKTD